MHKLALSCSLLLIVILTACSSNSGSTSSGGGTAPPVSSTPPNSGGNGAPGSVAPGVNEFAGTYSGTVTYTISGLGISTSDSDAFTVVVGGDGKVSVNGTYAGSLSGDSFSISASGTETVNGITCSGTVSVSGSVSGNTISGTFPPTTLDCGGLPLEFSGSFTATKN